MELEILKAVAGYGGLAVFAIVVFFMFTKTIQGHREEVGRIHQEHESELVALIKEKDELHLQDIACQKELTITQKDVALALKELIILIRSLNGKNT